MILLDTNVISEAMKPRPERAVMDWIDSEKPDGLWTCTIVVAEVFSGLDLMPMGKRQLQLLEKAEYMFETLFAGRICGFDQSAARAYGKILKNRQAASRPINQMDALVAATALAAGAILATRNTADFEQSGVQLLNPWP
ncbi:MAG: type II toxin-antitoxin system VapC family toxin [Terracidiphilus sp.]|jgi:predicted nucleic acid-binding protein